MFRRLKYRALATTVLTFRRLKFRSLATTVLELAGFAMIVTGIWQVSTVAGWISAGLALVLVGVLAA